MACNQITSTGDIELTPGSLGGSFCHKSWQKTYEDFIAATTVNFQNGAVFGAGDTEPGTDAVWFKQQGPSSCESLGWHYNKDNAWIPVPVPEAALPAVSGLPTAQTGSSTKNARITVDGYGRVTALDEVDPADETTDGHAKAWCKWTSTGGSSPTLTELGDKYNVASLTRTGDGTFTITTSDGLFSNIAIAIGSSPGFGAEDQTAGSYTGADHVRITSSTVSGSGSATIGVQLPRMVAGAENSIDGDVDWDNDKGEAPTDGVGVVIFGN